MPSRSICLQPCVATAILCAAAVLAVMSAGCSSAGRSTQTRIDNATPSLEDQPNPDTARLAAAAVARSVDENAPVSGSGIETVALFRGPMPTGVCVSKTGRVFVCFPRWGDPVDFTVGEVRNGRVEAYPNATSPNTAGVNAAGSSAQSENFTSVQSVVVDANDRLWILDTGSINFGPIQPGGAKLVCYDLATDRMVKRIGFPETVALSTSYLNDVRFNLAMGSEGMAFITDSSSSGPNGIIVVDLGSGESWRKLNDHPSTRADTNFVPTVEGEPLTTRPGNGPPTPLSIGVDGIAISADGRTLYYCPLASRRLSSISTEALADRSLSDAATAAAVRDLGTRSFASDGLHTDPRGNLLLTDYEHNAIRRRIAAANGTDADYEIVAQDPRMIWPDTLDVTSDGAGESWVYFICNQLNRQARFHDGKDERKPPYVLFRARLEERRAS